MNTLSQRKRKKVCIFISDYPPCFLISFSPRELLGPTFLVLPFILGKHYFVISSSGIFRRKIHQNESSIFYKSIAFSFTVGQRNDSCFVSKGAVGRERASSLSERFRNLSLLCGRSGTHLMGWDAVSWRAASGA